MSTQVNLKEFVAGFILETDEHLHSVNRNLVATSEALKKGKPEPRAIRELFRSLHTIKGLASMVGIEPIVDISHEMESILRTADRAGGRLSEKSLDLLLKGTRALEERLHEVAKKGAASVTPAPSALLEALGALQTSETEAAPKREVKFSLPEEILKNLSASDREQVIQANQSGRHTYLIEFQPSQEKAEKGLNITTVRERLTKIGELIKVMPRASKDAPTGILFSLLLITQTDIGTLAQAAACSEDALQEVKTVELFQDDTHPEKPSELELAPEWMPTDHSSIRVDIRRLDEALERLSELVITRSKFSKVESEMAGRGIDTRELKIVIAENTRQLKRLRAAITEARMVPLAELFQRLPLVVRGLTNNTQKTVNLAIQTGSAEVDKAVADKLFPAVVHLIRNAVDHAIESRDGRKASGKNTTGNISVICDDALGTSLVITIADDGRGIDRQAVAKKAVLPVARTNEELLNQISSPGLSTKEEISHTSGRGMGMEIVIRTIEMLGGTMSLTTEEGKGTTFTLKVPVSITIVDVLIFSSGNQTFAAPISMVDEIVEVDSAQAVKSPVNTKSGFAPLLIQRRGETIPLLGLNETLHKMTQTFTSRKALVVNQHRGAIAFGVDRMLGQQEVVVRPLDDLLVQRRGVVGATDLGDGKPTLVLDLASLGMTL